jgi:hypothetical protein
MKRAKQQKNKIKIITKYSCTRYKSKIAGHSQNKSKMNFLKGGVVQDTVRTSQK